MKMEVNAHHNYAAREKHFGEMVWVHRKAQFAPAVVNWVCAEGHGQLFIYRRRIGK